MSADKRFGHVCCSTRSRSTSHAFIDLPLLHVSNSVEYCALDIERANEPVSLLCGTSSHPACWQTGQRSLCSIRASTTTSVSLRPVQRRSWFVAFPATWNINSCEVRTHCKRTVQLSLLQHGTRFNTEIVERSIYLVQSDFHLLVNGEEVAIWPIRRMFASTHHCVKRFQTNPRILQKTRNVFFISLLLRNHCSCLRDVVKKCRLHSNRKCVDVST